MRETPRNRRQVRTTTLTLLRPLFRYSAGRDAYVLRVVGNRFGPVLRPAMPGATVSAAPPQPHD
jgi:hypothetical protein